ncbi:MAG TPA: hypothetical protein VH165_00365 [Kofleriaceae bacterium]|jgi:hypothetical protein|nr:hypothetical protein [Kofleriaceae bacterium]
MRRFRISTHGRAALYTLAAVTLAAGCGGGHGAADGGSGGDDQPGPDATQAQNGPAAGNPDGTCAVPTGAGAEDVSSPTTVVGTGTPASCTGDAVVTAVAKGGVITFNCGPDPVTITLTATAKIFNDTGPKIVIDGGGKVALSGGGKIRILYQDTCDAAQHITSPDCNNLEAPALTVQNLAFVDGNATGLEKGNNEGGGGAIYVRGGRFKAVNARFFDNICDDLGSDVGGGAIRVLDFPTGGSVNRPVYIVHSTFGGADGFGNHCANGGAISSIGTSYTVINSLLTDNQAVGHGANSGQGGNGGAIYNDGNTYNLDVCGDQFEHNHANEGGSAVFYVSNDKSGMFSIEQSVIQDNPKGTFETAGFPGLFVQATAGSPVVTSSTIGP